MADIRNMLYIGMSQHPDSLEVGRQTARIALNKMKPGTGASWVLAFCGGRHTPELVLQGLRSQLGEVEIVGGSVVGTITNSATGYTGYECAVALFPSFMPKPAIVRVNNLNKGEMEAGRQLGAKLHDISNTGDTILLFYDAVRCDSPLVLNIGSRLIDGVYNGLGDKQLNMIGSGLVGNFQLTQSQVFDGYRAVKNTMVAVVLPAVFSSYTAIMHGCIPVSSFLEITRMEDSVIYELNGRPALEVLQEMTGHKPSSLEDEFSLTMILGEKHGDLYAPYEESAYVNRLIVSSNPKDGSVKLFEADFQVGTKIQIMTRDERMMTESMQKQIIELFTSLGAKKPIGALYIDCAGRTCVFSGGNIEEAKTLQTELGEDIPLLGFYSWVGISPLLGRVRPLNWTGVLTTFVLEDVS